jgi:transmembrane sensor
MQTNNRLAILIIKHLDNELSDTENRELQDMLAISEKNRSLFEELTNPELILKELEVIFSFDAKAGWNELMQRHGLAEQEPPSAVTLEPRSDVNLKPRSAFKLWYYIAAAAFIGLIAFAWYKWSGKTTPKNTTVKKINIDSIAYLPSGSSPLLILDSMEVEPDLLDSFNNKLIWQGPVFVKKSGADTLKYEYYDNWEVESRQFKFKFYVATNIIVTPPGRRLKVILPEGTKVALEPASTLSFMPDMRKERRIHSLNGELHFDVADNHDQPFRIRFYDVDLEVLGTRFSVVANRKTKTIRTSLHDGRLLIRNRTDSLNLSSGQVAMASSGGQILLIENGKGSNKASAGDEEYRFTNDSFTAVMAKIEKWYGLQVEYKTKIPNDTFTAGIDQNTPIEDVITMLEERFHIHIIKRGNKLLVLP